MLSVLMMAAALASYDGSFAELKFDCAGALESVLEKPTGRELVGEKCPFMDVTLDDGRVFPATSARRTEGGGLAFSFAPLAGEAEVRLVPFAGGWTIETVRFGLEGVKTWTIAHVKPGCDKWYGDMACLVSDERSGVALRAYDPLLRTACDEIPNRDAHSLYDAPDLAFYPTPEQVASGLMIRADAPDGFVGRRCGLCAGPRERLRDMLKAMTVEAGVPYSKAGGAWALEAECNRGSYLFTTLMDEASAQDWVEMLELGGFTTAHPYGWWNYYGLYSFNAELFPNGLEGLKGNCRVFHDAGYRVDLHHLSHCIQYVEPCFMPEVTVDPDDVVVRCTYTLARPFAPGDTTMYVNEKPWDGHTVIMKSHANGNALMVGREIVQYHDMSFEKPYRFSKISRGSFKTQYYGEVPIKVSSETFPAGTPVRYLQQRYGSFYPKPGSKLMEGVSAKIGEIFNACEADGVYFDGAEGMMTIYGTEKGRETTFRKFRQKDGEIICESACLYPYSWWYRSRIGPWDHAEWGAKRFVNEHIRSLDEYATKANLLRVNLGWWGPMMGCTMARQHFSDEMEYNGCKGAAIDAADGFQLPDPVNSVNKVPVHFHTEDQLAIFGWWERARMARAFTDEVMARIRRPGDEFRLRQDETGLWRVAPQQVTSHAVKDAPYAAWTVDEPESRRAELRVEALYGACGYRSEGSKSILAPSDCAALVKKSAEGVSVSVRAGSDGEKGETLVVEASNSNAFSDGAWARVGKRYPVPYIAVEKAIGLWVKGDGSGALLNVQLEQAIACYHGYSEHYIRLDFEGWRYFALQLRERDAYDYYNHKWPYSHYRINTATEVYRTEIMGQTVEYVNLYLNDVPANGRTRVEVTDVRSIARCERTIRDGVVTLNGEAFAVPFEMKSTEVAELADGVWTLIDDSGTPIMRKRAEKMPRVRKGANSLAWAAKADDGYPRAEVTVLSVGDGEPAFKKGASSSRHLQVEAERPLVHAPSRGLEAKTVVRTRPGEAACLEVKVVGPVVRPVLTVTGVSNAFPVTLGSNDVLRVKEGRDWTVTRVEKLKRPIVAKGVLKNVLTPFTGAVAVSLSSEDEAGAAARLSLLKRYRPARRKAESFGPLEPSAVPYERQYIWPDGKMPDVQPHQVAAKSGEKAAPGFKADAFRRPYIDWYAPNPDCKTDLCVVTVSGGGFGSCCDAARLQPAIDRLVKAGVTVADVTYRTPRPKGLPIHQSAWEDLQRAVRVVRSQAAKRGFDPAKIGATGISAGAKAVLLVATSSLTPAYEPVDEIDALPCSLMFAIPQAPAYVLTDGDGTPNSRDGDAPDVRLAPELKFDAKTCPMCFFQGGIDDYSPFGTTQIYRQLRRMKIPAEIHLFADRWHGFHGDMNKGDEGTGWDHWFHRAEEFIRQMNYDGRLGEEVALLKRFPDDSARGGYSKEDVWPAGKIPDVQTNQCTPYIEWHLPKEMKTKAIQIIYSGGCYNGNNPNGFEVAPARRYLNERGMTVVTLKYRVPRPLGGLAKHTTAWQDLQRTVRLVRSQAMSRGLDPNRIGIMGSSAGGHLTLMGATSSRHKSYWPIDDIDKVPCNVQWAVAIYPAYSLTDGANGGNVHGGNDDGDRLVPEFSFDLDTCPVLFVHGDADGHSAMTSVKVWEQLRRMGVQGELHTLATRNHCFQRVAAPGTGSYTYLDRIWEFMNHKGFK